MLSHSLLLEPDSVSTAAGQNPIWQPNSKMAMQYVNIEAVPEKAVSGSHCSAPVSMRWPVLGCSAKQSITFTRCLHQSYNAVLRSALASCMHLISNLLSHQQFKEMHSYALEI